MLQQSSMYLNTACFAPSLVLQPLPFTSSRLSVLKKDSASALSQANRGRRGVRRDAAGCARVGADGCRGFARGRAPAGSGRFRRKRVLNLLWVLGFCAVFGGGRSLSASPTWGNVCAVRRFGPIRPAKPLRSCKRGLLVLRVTHLNVRSGSAGASRRHCECDSASVGLDELWLVSQLARCYRVWAIFFRDILPDIIWPKSGQNVKMSRKKCHENSSEASWTRSRRAMSGLARG